MKQEEYFGRGSIYNLKEIIEKENAKNIFLVSGKNSLHLSGAGRKLEKIFFQGSVKFDFLYNFSPNPQFSCIEDGFLKFKEKKYDLIVGIGGGSSIDFAKTIKLFSFERLKKDIPLVAIPTTAGSGSEATYFIVYYKDKEKQSKGNPKITTPNYSICDPDLIMSLPRKIAASSGMDALSQAIESYWSINSTRQSKKFAEKSISILIEYLRSAVNKPNLQNRTEVMRAANLSGKAINITKTTACHSISYPLTSYFNIPHGHAVGLTLGEMLVYNSNVTEKDCNDIRGSKYVVRTIDNLSNLLKSQNPISAKENISKLMSEIGLETSLKQLGLKNNDLDILIKKGFTPERVKNNPRELNEKELKSILYSILK